MSMNASQYEAKLAADESEMRISKYMEILKMLEKEKEALRAALNELEKEKEALRATLDELEAELPDEDEEADEEPNEDADEDINMLIDELMNEEDNRFVVEEEDE
jgi:predicted RNase H-like nuclease (RuvC/YqgF family)